MMIPQSEIHSKKAKQVELRGRLHVMWFLNYESKMPSTQTLIESIVAPI